MPNKKPPTITCYVNVYKNISRGSPAEASVSIDGSCVIFDTGRVRVAVVHKDLKYFLDMTLIAGGKV